MDAASAIWTVWTSATQAAISAGFCSGRVTDDVVEVVEEVATTAGVEGDELHAGTTAKIVMAPKSSPAVTTRCLLWDATP
jgi:hypothetical protein